MNDYKPTNPLLGGTTLSDLTNGTLSDKIVAGNDGAKQLRDLSLTPAQLVELDPAALTEFREAGGKLPDLSDELASKLPQGHLVLMGLPATASTGDGNSSDDPTAA